MKQPIRVRAVFVVLWLLGAMALESSAESRIVYRRSSPVEAWTGVVALRQVEEAVVDIPVDCVNDEPGTFGCLEARRFSRVYGLDFGLERRDSRDGTTRIEVERRGRVFLLLQFDAADRKVFDDELRLTLAGLSADAFSESFAGLKAGSGPFSGIARRSVEPSWSCLESDESRQVARFDRTVEQRPDGSTVVRGSGMTGYGIPEVTEPVCDQATALVGSQTYPEELRTMPVLRALREETVRVDFADGLRSLSYPEDLVELPPDLTYTVERSPGVIESGSLRTATEDPFVRAAYTKDEVKFTAAARPIRLAPDLVRKNAWVAQWTVETTARQMGPRPSERVVDRSAAHVVLMPTFPPENLDDEPAAEHETYRVALDTDALLDEIGVRLDRQATLDTEVLETVLTQHPAGLSSQGWIMIVCRGDGSTDYWLLPTRASSPLTNADVFCAAAEASLATDLSDRRSR